MSKWILPVLFLPIVGFAQQTKSSFSMTQKGTQVRTQVFNQSIAALNSKAILAKYKKVISMALGAKVRVKSQANSFVATNSRGESFKLTVKKNDKGWTLESQVSTLGKLGVDTLIGVTRLMKASNEAFVHAGAGTNHELGNS